MFDFANTFPPEMAFPISHPVKDYATSVSTSVVHHLAPSHYPQPKSQAAADAKAHRALEFSQGRICADAALIELGCNLPRSARKVGVNDDRSPIWPHGFVGSISHSCHWTWAAVAHRAEITSVGIDTEPIMTTETMRQVENEIASQSEWDKIHGNTIGRNAWTQEEKTTLVFSAKEAFYKCWFPVHRQYFGFVDALVDQVEVDRIRIRSGPMSPNAGNGPEFLDVFFYKTDSDIFSFTWMSKE